MTDPMLGRTMGGCQIERRIGSGALAIVYQGRRLADNQTVAIKLLTDEAAADDDFRARFLREAELCHRLTHPNIITVYEQGECDGHLFLVMELVEGRNMEEVIDQTGPMPWLQAAELFLQLGQALAYLGKHGVIHRDIKPGNIILTEAGVAKLIDLGFAKGTSHDADPANPELTVSGVALGSPGYMPPEQILDAKEVTHAADIYGLGASFFHALTGQPPFQGSSVQQIMDLVLSQPAPSAQALVPAIPPAISRLIDSTLSKEPHKRPENAARFVRDLENAIYRPGGSSHQQSQATRRFDLTTLLCILVPVILLVIVVARKILKT